MKSATEELSIAYLKYNKPHGLKDITPGKEK